MHPMARLSPCSGLCEGEECLRSLSLARSRASFLSSDGHICVILNWWRQVHGAKFVVNSDHVIDELII